MMNPNLLIHREDLDFLLQDVVDSAALLKRERYADHSPETFSAAIDTAHKLAAEYFAPHNRRSDENEPVFDGEKVTTLPEIGTAVRAFAQAGFLAATHDYELGGMQLPVTISQACLAVFRAANVGTSAYCFLTAANANLIRAFGTEDQKRRYLPALLEGRWLGTMALTEPNAGSSVPDLRSTATPLDDGRYAIKGQKIFISGVTTISVQTLSIWYLHACLTRLRVLRGCHCSSFQSTGWMRMVTPVKPMMWLWLA